jgi:hypothetical protein
MVMDMIKNEIMTEKEIGLLREQFKVRYCESKGWDPENLTTEQLLEITSHKNWKTPGLLLS